MTISEAAGVTAVTVNSVVSRPGDRPGAGLAGWDPYEVWRTRVLVPRLAEQAARTDAIITEPRGVGPRFAWLRLGPIRVGASLKTR